MNSRPLLASLLCASLASLTPVVAHAQLPPAGVSAVAVAIATRHAEPVVTSVLGLRSQDKKAGERLTTSLRSAFAEREMSGGQELTLEEVVLTLDCASEADTACMTEAGSALEAQKLVYGSLEKSGGSYVVEISVLDVTTGQVEAQGTLPFEKEALSAGNVDATALEVVNSLYPEADSSAIAPIPADTTPAESDGQLAAEPKDDRYIWGAYEPRPKWKKVGLGVSVGFTVLGIAASATSWALLKGRYEVRVSDERRTIGDGRRAEETPEYCQRTAKEDKAGMTNAAGDFEVEHLRRAEQCNNLLGARAVNLVGTSVAVAAGISTVVFAVLHFVHKNKGAGANAQRDRKRRFRLTGGPTQGGAMFGGTGRF